MRKYWVDEGMRAFCSIPLLSHDRALGALDLGRRREDAFGADEVELLSEVAKQIAIAVENAQAYRQITELKERLAKEKLYLEEEIRTEHNFEEIVGESAALRRVLKEVETVAPTDSTVLIRGETGTGKELIARALHELSPRRERTFVKINCAAIPTGLLESELFGHEKGAFTGAIMQKIGRFELAHEGTLFLDEVGDIPPELQPKLLRVLQEQEFERLGSTRTVRVDVRLVAATNRDLGQMAAERRVPQRPLLSAECVPGHVAAAARAPRRHPALRSPFRAKGRPANGPADRNHSGRGHGRAGAVSLAGQCPRAGERHRARGHSFAGPCAADQLERVARQSSEVRGRRSESDRRTVMVR